MFITIKGLFQDLCKLKIDWNEPLCDELNFKYTSWLSDLMKVQSISIDRCYFQNVRDQVTSLQIHDLRRPLQKLYPLKVITTEVADASSPTGNHPEQRLRRKAAVVGEMKRRQVDQCFAELDDYDEHWPRGEDVWILWDIETTPSRRTLRARDHVTRARYFKFLWRVRFVDAYKFFSFLQEFVVFFSHFVVCHFSRLFLGIKFGVWAYNSRRTFS